MVIKRYLIPTIIIFGLISGQLIACNSVTTSQKPTTAELQAEIERLRNELNQQREQKKAELLKQAEAYNAIVIFCSVNSSGATTIQRVTAEAIAEQLKASSKFQNELLSLIGATRDPVLISRTQPQKQDGLLPVIPVSLSYIKDYAQTKHKELIAEYNNQ